MIDNEPATQRVKPLMNGDQPMNEQSTDLGESYTQRLSSAKVMCILEYVGTYVYCMFTYVIDPYHARAKVCCSSKLRLRNIWLPSGGLKCTETYGTPSFWRLGCLNYTEFLNYKNEFVKYKLCSSC